MTPAAPAALRRTPRRRRTARGFSLIETLTAGSLLVVALTGVTLMSLASAQNNARASSTVEAIRVAQDQTNRFKALGFLRLNAMLATAADESSGGVTRKRIFPTDAQLSATPPFRMKDAQGRELDLRVYVEDVAGAMGGAAFRLRTSVKWLERNPLDSRPTHGKHREQTYETIVSTNL